MNQFVPRISLPRYLLALVGTVLIGSIATQAKLTFSPSVLLHSAGVPIWESDFAFDTETNVGLGVFRQKGMLKVRGVYVGPTGAAASAVFDLTTSAANEVRGPRLAARSGGGGGFLVTSFLAGDQQTRAIFVHPSSSTILGPVTIDSEVVWYSNPGGVAYVAEHDAFLVAYRKNDHAYVKWVKVVGGSLQVSSAVQLTSGACNYIAAEIAWDFERDIALVTGWIDGDGCGGVWMRRIGFNGSTISPLGSQATIGGARYSDVRVAFSDLIDKWLVIYVKQATTAPRHVLGNTIDPNGVVGSQRTILPANTGNLSIADDKFGGNNGLGLAYNPFNGRFLVGVRGNDSADTGGLAPLYAVELDTNGVAIPKTFDEVLSFDIASPWPRLAAIPNSQNFLMMVTGGPGAPFGDLRSVRVTADGQQGTGTWPLAGGGGSGGGGEDPPPPPPPPPPSGSVTLTLTRPSGGLILGTDIYCGTTSAAGTKCQVTKPAGTTIKLTALPASGNTLTSWGGCASSFALTANKSCAPTFSGGGGPLPPPPSGAISLTLINPSNGGPGKGGNVHWSGVGWIAPGQSASRTYPAPTAVTLLPIPQSGYRFAGWIGTGCANSMTVNNERTCIANFSLIP